MHTTPSHLEGRLDNNYTGINTCILLLLLLYLPASVHEQNKLTLLGAEAGDQNEHTTVMPCFQTAACVWSLVSCQTIWLAMLLKDIFFLATGDVTNKLSNFPEIICNTHRLQQNIPPHPPHRMANPRTHTQKKKKREKKERDFLKNPAD